MPATTRSANKQTKLEDVGAGSKETLAQTQKKKNPPKTAKKRGPDESFNGPATKRKKPSSKNTNSSATAAAEQEDEGVITINRAPVLELWSACVTELLHPSLSWNTCLSIGGAISTITAISKGRSIGTMSKPDPGDAQAKKEERKAKAEREWLEEVEVMGFNLSVDEDGNALVGGKGKKASEEALRKKFGAEEYESVRGVFRDALREWKGREEELGKRAFGFYEDFRPSIPPGQKGWGRKGQLRLESVRTTVGEG